MVFRPFPTLLLALSAIGSATPGVVSAESRCFGTPKAGRIEGAVRLPRQGKNFEAYALVPYLAGRTYVHSRVSDVLLAAFKRLEEQAPGVTYVYAETGYEDGGEFSPHKTHQNGTSVDIHVPVLKNGQPDTISRNVLNRYGYGLEFDRSGKADGYLLDFDSLAKLILALVDEGKRLGTPVQRVIFDPRLIDRLYQTSKGDELRSKVTIPRKDSWVRHDEHIHVDFEVWCRPL